MLSQFEDTGNQNLNISLCADQDVCFKAWTQVRAEMTPEAFKGGHMSSLLEVNPLRPAWQSPHYMWETEAQQG